jgi:DNA-binding FrmR family transcriptional regulator
MSTSSKSKISPESSSSTESTPNHKAELHRLKRINGQIEGIGRMIEEGRYCPDILIQTRAVTSAIRSLEASLLERHLNHCVRSAFQSEDDNARQAKLAELVEIFRSRIPK